MARLCRQEMVNVVGVRFRETGRIYYFDPADFAPEVGEYVVVRTARGLEVGRVVIAPHQVLAQEISEPLKPILRLADAEDLDNRDRWRAKAREALERARQRAAELGLPISIAEAEYSLDGTVLNLDFTADEKVNLRDLQRSLAQELDVRVQLRQIGPRDRAKLTGGMGICGRPLCCGSWLSQFPTIAIKMAKEQDLAPNPEKISGLCGRLRCCLSYENDVYRELRANLPKKGQTVRSSAGCGRVVGANVIKQTVFLELESHATVEVAVQDLREGAASPEAAPAPGEGVQPSPPAAPGQRRRRRRSRHQQNPQGG